MNYDDCDPQHQAVRDATAQLRANRYWDRGAAAQHDYLADLEQLAREFAFLLTRAGVTWTDLQKAGHPDNQPQIEQRLFTMSSEGQLEYVLSAAIDRRRGSFREE